MSAAEQAERAQRILEDPLFNQVLLELDQGAVETWRRSTNAQQREDQWHMVTAIAALHVQLKRRLQDIQLADRAYRRAAGQRSAGV